MGVTAVLGLQWGDEGKGKVVDALGGDADIVVRCQGGANAGHTVIIGGDKFILHLIPSGILRDSATCMIGNGVAVDLEVLADEIHELAAVGVDAAGRLVLSQRAHVVLPLHKAVEEIEEDVRGKGKLGTTMRGIGPCYRDKYARFGIRVEDILDTSRLRVKAENLLGLYGPAYSARPECTVDEIMEYCRGHAEMIREISGDVPSRLREGMDMGKTILLEGSQGFLLDIDHGTYPFVTSSNTGIHGIACGAGLAPSAIENVIGVVKSYMTRVGEGPLPTQMEEPCQTMVREKGQEYGATTGRARRCGWIDLNALRHSSRINGVTSIVLTKLDTLSGLDNVKVCTAYEYYGNRIDYFPSDSDFLAKCRPRYLTVDGWGDIAGAKDMDELPPAARSYVNTIGEAAGSRIDLVSTGPGRDEIIGLDR
jgi:adenylosuccinate synthase